MDITITLHLFGFQLSLQSVHIAVIVINLYAKPLDDSLLLNNLSPILLDTGLDLYDLLVQNNEFWISFFLQSLHLYYEHFFVLFELLNVTLQLGDFGTKRADFHLIVGSRLVEFVDLVYKAITFISLVVEVSLPLFDVLL